MSRIIGGWLATFASWPLAAAEASTPSMTGIPIEWMFAIVSALIAALYLDMKRDLRATRAEGMKRTQDIIRIKIFVRQVCRKLHIDYSDPGDRDHD
jgi:hypothetical protein